MRTLANNRFSHADHSDVIHITHSFRMTSRERAMESFSSEPCPLQLAAAQMRHLILIAQLFHRAVLGVPQPEMNTGSTTGILSIARAVFFIFGKDSSSLLLFSPQLLRTLRG